MVPCVCTQCSGSFKKERGQLNRALKDSPGRLFCSQKCTGLARRRPRLPIAERKARKAAYDKIRRTQLADEIRAEKRERHKLTYTYEAAKAQREERKRRFGASYHAEYCRKRFERNPALKRGKRLYDRARRDRLNYADFAECARLLRKLQAEIRKRAPSFYERRKARGYYDQGTRTVQQRKRNEQLSRW